MLLSIWHLSQRCDPLIWVQDNANCKISRRCVCDLETKHSVTTYRQGGYIAKSGKPYGFPTIAGERLACLRPPRAYSSSLREEGVGWRQAGYWRTASFTRAGDPRARVLPQ